MVDIKRIDVIGAGTMGHAIAQVCAQRYLDYNFRSARRGAAATVVGN